LLLREADDEMLAEKPPPSAWRPGISAALLAAVIAALAGFAVVYVTLGRPDNAVQSATPAPAPSAPPSGTGVDPLSRGHMAAFVFRKAPEELPEVKFLDAEGKERTLAHWRGKVVLLNLWATWCLPCRKEMPSLDRLQKEMGSDKFEVVAISVDRKGAAASKKFLDETQVERLALYVDATARLSSELRVVGLPATLLLDAQGREIGRLLGGAEWDSEDAKRLIRSALQ
jgi:thiol-disulfide isomerase/thioredoxin